MGSKSAVRVGVLTIGDELLDGSTLDTNMAYAGRLLAEAGAPPNFHATVPDDLEAISRFLDLHLHDLDILVVTGGLGPTTDDLTVEAFASHLGLPLRENSSVADGIRGFWTSRGRDFGSIPDAVYKQALVPEGAEVVINECGTAPGVAICHASARIFLLPGPPREMRPMFAERILPMIKARIPLEHHCEMIVTMGVPESTLQELVHRVLGEAAPCQVAYCVEVGGCRLSFKGIDSSVVMGAASSVRLALGLDALRAGFRTVEEDVVELLTRAGLTLALAESCTGGLVGAKVTDVPGASAVLRGGVVAYSNLVKSRLLSVADQTLEKFGAVSSECALEMARGVRSALSADIGLSTTGIAGPGGGTASKPVGLVHIAFSTPWGEFSFERRHHGERAMVRGRAAADALDQLRRRLMLEDALTRHLSCNPDSCQLPG